MMSPRLFCQNDSIGTNKQTNKTIHKDLNLSHVHRKLNQFALMLLAIDPLLCFYAISDSQDRIIGLIHIVVMAVGVRSVDKQIKQMVALTKLTQYLINIYSW